MSKGNVVLGVAYLTFGLIYWLGGIALTCGLLYAAYHFITKLW